MPHPATFRRLVETARRRSALQPVHVPPYQPETHEGHTTPGKLPFGDCQYRQPRRSLYRSNTPTNAPYRVRILYSTRSAGFHFLTADFW